MKREIILASSSPRRRELLTACSVKFKIISPDCDETVLKGESAEAMVKRLALLKAETVANQNPEALVIGADTTVLLGEEILGKPLDQFDAANMLNKIQDQVHHVWGGIALVCKSQVLKEVTTYCSKVKMLKMTPEMITGYVATKEPLDKAGSYAIQGIGLQFVEWIEGSYSNVVGLNISALMSSLRAHNAI